MRQFESANTSINEYLKSHPNHTHAPEATVLRGDILMGTGDLDHAIVAFNSVGPEAKGLYPYAVFQIGKIHKSRAKAWMSENLAAADRELDLMITHFQRYVKRDDIPNKTRVGDALFSMAWAHSQKGELLKAFPILTDSLEHFGNDRNSNEMLAILNGIHKLHVAFRKNLPDKFPDIPLLKARNFTDWVESERAKALQKNQLTYYSRLSMYLNDFFRKKDPAIADLAGKGEDPKR